MMTDWPVVHFWTGVHLRLSSAKSSTHTVKSSTVSSNTLISSTLTWMSPGPAAHLPQHPAALQVLVDMLEALVSQRPFKAQLLQAPVQLQVVSESWQVKLLHLSSCSSQDTVLHIIFKLP